MFETYVDAQKRERYRSELRMPDIRFGGRHSVECIHEEDWPLSKARRNLATLSAEPPVGPPWSGYGRPAADLNGRKVVLAYLRELGARSNHAGPHRAFPAELE